MTKKRTVIDFDGSRTVAAVLERGERLKKLKAAITEAEIAQRIEVLRDLESCRNVSILDYFQRDKNGRLELRTPEELATLGGTHTVFLKKLKVKSRVAQLMHIDRETGVTTPEIQEQEVEIEVGDHLAVLKMLGDYLGLWDPEQNKLRGAGNRLLADKTDQELEEMIRAAEKVKVRA